MTHRITILVTLSLFTAFIAAPALDHRLLAQAKEQHDHDHAATATAVGETPNPTQAMMAGMMAADAKLDELVKKMNSTKGQAKTDAIAELLTALVQEHRTMGASMMANMTNMMSMMDMMGNKAAHGTEEQGAPKK
jgi:hypothetical protein